MSSSPRRPAFRALQIGAVAALSVVLAGCGGTITSDELERSVSESLGGVDPALADATVSCPDDVDAEVGATAECSYTVEGDDTEVGLAIEITSVDDGEFTADVVPEDTGDGTDGEASTIPAETLQTQIQDGLVEQEPDLPEPTITCPDDIPAEAGATGECTLTVEGDDTELPVSVEITSAENGEFTADFEVQNAS